MCILSVYALLKVVGYYDLSVLSMSVMGFQNKVWMECALYPIFLGFFEFFNFAKPLNKDYLLFTATEKNGGQEIQLCTIHSMLA